MENYEKLKSVIQAANPEIMELKFGCEVYSEWRNANVKHTVVYKNGPDLFVVQSRFGHPSGGTTKKINAEHIQIRGRPIRLADVLLAISKIRNSYSYAITDGGEFIKSEDIYRYNYTSENVEWNRLDDNLDNQSEETKQFLIDLLV